MICCSCGAATAPESERCARCGEGALLDGRYRLVEVLGQGAAGTSYRALRVADGRAFAVKELLVRRLDAAKTWALFDRECAVLAQLSHPSIPRFEERFQSGSGRSLGLYLVHALVEGQTLAHELQHRRFTVAEALEAMAQVLEVVAYLQAVRPQVVHRDIKPENLVRRASDGGLSLIDFGSVREAIGPAGSTLAGTPGYMAPEQLRGETTDATDVYSAACVAVAMLSRRPLHELLDARLRLGWRKAVDAPAPVRSLLARMLEPDARARAHDAAALAAEARRLSADPHRGGSSSALATVSAGLVAAALGFVLATCPGVMAPAPPAALPASAPSGQPPRAMLGGLSAGALTSRPLLAGLGPAAAAVPTKPSQCASEGRCLSARDGLMGVKVPDVCAEVKRKHEDAETVVLGVRKELPLPIAGETAWCQVHLVQASFCSVSCLIRTRGLGQPEFSAKAEGVVQFLRDSYGREAQGAFSGGWQTHWSWPSAERGPSLSVSATFIPNAGPEVPSDIHVTLTGPMR